MGEITTMSNKTETEHAGLYKKAREYDLVMGEFANHATLDFYRRQILRYGEPALELACGSGRLLIPLIKAGLDVIGLDISREMLDLAREKAVGQNVQVSLIQADVCSFDLGNTFNTILIATQSMQHLLKRDDLEAGLTSIQRHLKSQSRLVIEIFNPSLSLLSRDPEQRYPVGMYRRTDGGGSVLVTEVVRYDAATQINHIEWFYLDESTGVEESIRFSMRQFYPQEIEALLEYNGLLIEQKYGGYDESPFVGRASKQIMICRKSGD
jgi:ubiquinone/menaquinone biosynthesis C-methylase UbiE